MELTHKLTIFREVALCIKEALRVVFLLVANTHVRAVGHVAIGASPFVGDTVSSDEGRATA